MQDPDVRGAPSPFAGPGAYPERLFLGVGLRVCSIESPCSHAKEGSRARTATAAPGDLEFVVVGHSAAACPRAASPSPIELGFLASERPIRGRILPYPYLG